MSEINLMPQPARRRGAQPRVGTGCGEAAAPSPCAWVLLESVWVRSSWKAFGPGFGPGGFPESTVTSLLVPAERLSPHHVQGGGEEGETWCLSSESPHHV